MWTFLDMRHTIFFVSLIKTMPCCFNIVHAQSNECSRKPRKTWLFVAMAVSGYVQIVATPVSFNMESIKYIQMPYANYKHIIVITIRILLLLLSIKL